MCGGMAVPLIISGFFIYMNDEGWIKLHRSFKNHWLYTEKRPMTKREAWETILLKVNYEQSKSLIRGTLYDCFPGQSLFSIDSWAKEFMWSTQMVRTFFKMLENDNMIIIEGLQYTTRLTVCNWGIYQDKLTNQKQTDNEQITNGQQTDNKPITTIKEREEYKESKEVKEKKEYKNILLSEIKISDYTNLNKSYFDIALGFQLLIRKNIIELNAGTKDIDNTKGSAIDEIRLLIESDGFYVQDCKDVYNFLKSNEFWKKNILSIKTLRKKFNKLLIESRNGNTNKIHIPTINEHSEAESLANM